MPLTSCSNSQIKDTYIGSEGILFLPWNQVDLILRKSGQPFLWALVLQIRAILKNQSDSQKQLK